MVKQEETIDVGEWTLVTGRIRGTTSLLMHNSRTIDYSDDYARKMRELNKTKKAKGADVDEINTRLSFTEWRAGLYWRGDIGPHITPEMLFACLIEGARLTRNGRDVERGVLFGGNMPLIYDGPRDIKGLWDARTVEDEGFGDDDDPVTEQTYVDRRPVTVGTARVIRTRPRFPSWALDFEAHLNTEVITPEDFVLYLAKAGKLVGLADGRRRILQGRFEVIKNSIKVE